MKQHFCKIVEIKKKSYYDVQFHLTCIRISMINYTNKNIVKGQQGQGYYWFHHKKKISHGTWTTLVNSVVLVKT